MTLITDVVNMEEVERQIELGMVKRQLHPTSPLAILNYTQMAQFTSEPWNETTDRCRGLIYNTNSLELVGRPFVKFWNYLDNRHPETLPENFPPTLPKVTKKMDGSLGIGYGDETGYSVATRGSFMSDQAIWATAWIRSNTPCNWPAGFTPLFEVVYPENQIVVRYDWSGLILLALVHLATGEELDHESCEAWASVNGIKCVERCSASVPDLAKEDIANSEGYVVSWDRRNTHPIRIKIKYENYCRLHKLLTQTSAVGIWELMRDGKDISLLLADVPTGFADWVRLLASRLQAKFDGIETEAKERFNSFEGTLPITNPEEKKQFALWAIQQGESTPILFSMVSGKDYAPLIWKIVRPRGDEKRYAVDE